MTATSSPKISRGPRFPVVWLVPLIALLVGSWLIFREVINRGPEITLHFPDGSGVEPGRTEMTHNGVTIGRVQGLALEKDLKSVVVKLRLNKDAEAFARTGAQFWIVRPQVSFSGVRGLSTLIAGVQINGHPGAGAPAKEFVGIDHEPAPEDASLGRAFLLRADKLGSLNTGAPVYYREVKVGVVETSRLAEDATGVLIRIRVHTPYIDLVRRNTEFWNAGGVAFKVNLLGAEVKTTSLESIFTGGVAFATPDKDGLAPVAEEGEEFALHDAMDKDWAKWRPRIPITPVETEPTRNPRAPEMPMPLKGN